MSESHGLPAGSAAGRLPRADLVMGLVLAALGIGVVVESWRMPRLQELGVNIYTAPGLVPGLIGAVITFLALILLFRAIRFGALRNRPAASRDGLGRLALALCLTLGYAAVLVGRVPFWLATFLFVLAFIATFEWRPRAGARARALTTAFVEAVLVAAIVSAVFQYLFLVRLP